MALSGYSDEQVKDAAWAVQSVTGASAYIYATEYDRDQFNDELEQIVDHVRGAVAG